MASFNVKEKHTGSAVNEILRYIHTYPVTSIYKDNKDKTYHDIFSGGGSDIPDIIRHLVPDKLLDVLGFDSKIKHAALFTNLRIFMKLQKI